jgi:hypothetical protein
MSWIVQKPKAFDTLYLVEGDHFTTNRDNAKPFETKHDAAAYMKQYDITGHIIPA